MLFLKRFKWICCILTTSILMESCHVYEKIPSDIEKATASNMRVKITTTDNQKYFFKRIEKTDSLYYGVEEVGLDVIKKPLKKEDLKKVQIINKPKSRFLTVAGITIPIAILVMLISSNSWSSGAGPVGGF